LLNGRRRDSGVLTKTEKEILLLLAQGASARETADAASLRLPTVERYIVRLRFKMGARNTPHLIALAFLKGALKVVTGVITISE
jgi:DNA-binding CsgD family transcriptional regulator